MSGWALGVRRRVADNYEVIVLGVVLVGLCGGYLTYATHLDPGTETTTREVAAWESSGEFTHRATVHNGTAAFPEGRTLHNRTVYFREVTPRLNGIFAYRYRATGAGDLDVGTTLSLEFRSIEQAEEGEGEPTVLWQTDRVLAEDEQSLAPGERTTVAFSTNVSDAAAELQRIDDQHGGTPGQLEVAVVADVAITGTRNGQSVDVSRTYRLPIEPGDSVYRVRDPGPITASDERTRTVTTQRTYGPLRAVAGPLLIVLPLATLGVLAYGRRRGVLSVTAAERDWLTYKAQRDEFASWITTGRLPADAREAPAIDVDSLEGVVDVAIDTNGRVIADENRGVFVVFADDRRYRFQRPPDPTDRPEPPESDDQ